MDDTPLNEQKSNVGNKKDIGDEYHYLFSCDFFLRMKNFFIWNKYM